MCNADTFIQQHVNHHHLLPLSTSFADQRQVNKNFFSPPVTQPPLMLFSTNQSSDVFFLRE